MNVQNHANFDVESIEVNQEYQYKEGSIIFNFVLKSIVEDEDYIYLLGDVSEKIQKKYGIQRFELTVCKENHYYSGMSRIMKKDTYFENNC